MRFALRRNTTFFHNIDNNFQLHLVLLFPHFTTLEKVSCLGWYMLRFRLNFFLAGFLTGCIASFRFKTVASIISKTFSVSFAVSIWCNSKAFRVVKGLVKSLLVGWLACAVARNYIRFTHQQIEEFFYVKFFDFLKVKLFFYFILPSKKRKSLK